MEYLTPCYQHWFVVYYGEKSSFILSSKTQCVIMKLFWENLRPVKYVLSLVVITAHVEEILFLSAAGKRVDFAFAEEEGIVNDSSSSSSLPFYP